MVRQTNKRMTNKKIYAKDFKFINPAGVSDVLWDLACEEGVSVKPEVDYFKYVYLVHRVTTHQYTHHYSHNESAELKDYAGCPLHMTTLAQITGVKASRAAQLINNLIKLGIIKRTRGYVKGVSSMKYSLCEQPENYEAITVNNRYTSIASRLCKKHNQYVATNTEELNLYREFLGKLELCVEVSDVKDIVGEIADKANKPATTHMINSNELAVHTIKEGNWFAYRKTGDDRSRVYTNLTNLNREFRKYLKYEGRDMVELDIRNSQPLIASILIKNYFVQNNTDIPADVTEYKNNCEAGTFYDYFMELNGVSAENRTAFKQQLFAEVFFSKVSKRMTKLKKQFITKYPNCYKAICAIKGGEGSESYNQFAVLLQKKEASIIFDNINMGLLRDGIPAFNVFDSLIVPKEYKDLVEARIMDAFVKENLTPKINHTDYTEVIEQTKEEMYIPKTNIKVADIVETTLAPTGAVLTPIGNSVHISYRIDSNDTLDVVMDTPQLGNKRIADMDYNYIYKQSNK